MAFSKYLYFLRNRILFTIAYRKYMKEHPDYSFKLSEEDLERMAEDLIEKNRNKDTDCSTIDDRDLIIEERKLDHCSLWYIGKPSNRKDKVIYYIHGGGFTGACTKDRFGFISYAVKHFGYDVCSIDYRLSPEFKCLDILEDCLDGYRSLLERYEGKDICLMGESAGATLVLTLILKLKEEGVQLPAGLCSCSPLSQFEYYPYSYYENAGKSDFMIGFGTIDNIYPVYKGELDHSSPYMSPLYGDLSDFPKIYMDVSKHESMRDDARALYAKFRMLGNDIEYHELTYFGHAELVNPEHGYVRKEEYPKIISFLNRVLEQAVF